MGSSRGGAAERLPEGVIVDTRARKELSARLWARSKATHRVAMLGTARFMFEGSKHSESKQEARGPLASQRDALLWTAPTAERMRLIALVSQVCYYLQGGGEKNLVIPFPLLIQEG